jgi:hypothetical protein
MPRTVTDVPICIRRTSARRRATLRCMSPQCSAQAGAGLLPWGAVRFTALVGGGVKLHLHSPLTNGSFVQLLSFFESAM